MAGDMTLRDVSLSAAGGVTKKAQMALHALLRAPSVRRLLFSSTVVQLGDSFHGGISTPGTEEGWRGRGQSDGAAPARGTKQQAGHATRSSQAAANRHDSTLRNSLV